MGTPLRYGDHVSFPDIPEAVGVVCENPLGPYGILPQGMVWVRWPSGVAYSQSVSELVKVTETINIEGKTVLLRAAPRDPK